jgi:O-antigen/teichoic acid export membrane protein
MRDRGVELRSLVHRALALAALLAAAGTAAVVVWGHLTRGIGWETAAIAAAALGPNVVWQSISGVLLGLGRIRLWNWIQLLPTLLALAGLLVLVGGLDLGVRGAVLAWTASHVVTALVALVATQPLWRPVALDGLLDVLGRALARLALVMGAVQVVNLISYRVELYVLDRSRGTAAVGVYSIAEQVAESMWLVAGAMATSLTAPAMQSEERAAARMIGRAALRGLLLTAGLAVVVAAVAPFVIPLLLGHAFSGASRPLWFLLPGVVAYAPVTILVVYLSVRRGRPLLSLVVAVIGLVATLAAAVVLVPRYGASGAAAASTIGYAIGGAGAWFLFARLARRAS